MSRYMSMREQAELTEIVRELRDSGELTPRPRGEPERTEDYISQEDLNY